jgi:hypothetical protein
VTAGHSGCHLQIVDVDPPDTAWTIGGLELFSLPMDVAVSGRYACVLVQQGGLRIIKLW